MLGEAVVGQETGFAIVLQRAEGFDDLFNQSCPQSSHSANVCGINDE